MKKVILGLLPVLIGCYLGCSRSHTGLSFGKGDAEVFALNQAFTLSYGSDAHMDGNPGFRIEFKDIFRDNRCANEAICAWEGRVDAGINTFIDGAQAHDTLSKAGLGARTATDSLFVHNYKIKLLAVTPYPSIAAGNIPQEDYKLHFLVTPE